MKRVSQISKIILITLILFVSGTSFAQTDYNLVQLKSGLEIRLPELPADPSQAEAFLQLSEAGKTSFYMKRYYIVKYLTFGLSSPGVGSAIRWTKDKVKTIMGAIKGGISHADRVTAETGPVASSETIDTNEKDIRLDRIPENISARELLYVESSISALVNNIWANASHIAKSSSLGMTFVAGVIWNTSLGTKGYVFGRSLSVDIGINFNSNSGYMNFYYDKQSLARGGFSFDIGPVIDVMLHVMDSDIERGEKVEAVHQKLPMVGSFRSGRQYNAWGAQLGLHVLEIAGGVLTIMGMPEAGMTIIPAVRAMGMMTIYRTSLMRKSLGHITLSPESLLLRKLGVVSESRANLDGRGGAISCRNLFTH